MVDFGLSTLGLVIKRLADIKIEYEDGLRAIYGSNTKTDPQSAIGQMIGLISERESLLWELIEAVYNAPYLLTAEGAQLDNVVALVGLTRLPASSSTVWWTLTGTPGTIIPAGSTARLDDTQAVFETLTEVTIGTEPVVQARAQVTGPTRALAASTWTIASPIAGWTGITQASEDAPYAAMDADEGANVESDQALRVRYIQALHTVPGDSADGLRAALLRLDGVTEVVIVENQGAGFDPDGRPGKSFEAVVVGGTHQEIIDAIWAGKPLGIETYGTIAGVAVDDRGDPQTVYRSEPTNLPIWIAVEYSADETFSAELVSPAEYDGDGDPLTVGEAEIRDALLDYEAVQERIGTSVYPWRMKQRIETDGLIELDLFVGLAAGPVDDSPIIVGKTTRALIDSTRITFRRV